MTDVELDGNSIMHATVAIDGGNGYRLPTEAEWEYACRASSRQRFHFGVKTDSRRANLQSRTVVLYGSSVNSSLKRTAETGSYKPNAWGLYDMHGNVAEWCWDWYGEDYYGRSPRQDPRGPDHGRHRVLRGGSWLLNESGCRSASRFYLTADQRTSFAGFRVARTP
jgi:formylglycine-generating enzyme required for sulfatase activity